MEEGGGGGDSAAHGGVQGAKSPEAEGFFPLNLRHENHHFLALYPVINAHSQNILYYA